MGDGREGMMGLMTSGSNLFKTYMQKFSCSQRLKMELGITGNKYKVIIN